jgi:plasmid stabilization system protein ParE
MDLADYLAQQDLAVAKRFLEAVEQTIEWLQRFPESGELWETAPDRYRRLRIWPVHGFPNHLVFYQSSNDRLEIIRVKHGAQNWVEAFDSP